MAAELPKEQQLSVEKLIECCKLSARWMGEGMRELNREVSLAYANYQHGPSFDFYLKRLGKLIAEDLSLGSNEDKPHVRVMTEILRTNGVFSTTETVIELFKDHYGYWLTVLIEPTEIPFERLSELWQCPRVPFDPRVSKAVETRFWHLFRKGRAWDCIFDGVKFPPKQLAPHIANVIEYASLSFEASLMAVLWGYAADCQHLCEVGIRRASTHGGGILIHPLACAIVQDAGLDRPECLKDFDFCCRKDEYPTVDQIKFELEKTTEERDRDVAKKQNLDAKDFCRFVESNVEQLFLHAFPFGHSSGEILKSKFFPPVKLVRKMSRILSKHCATPSVQTALAAMCWGTAAWCNDLKNWGTKVLTKRGLPAEAIFAALVSDSIWKTPKYLRQVHRCAMPEDYAMLGWCFNCMLTITEDMIGCKEIKIDPMPGEDGTEKEKEDEESDELFCISQAKKDEREVDEELEKEEEEEDGEWEEEKVDPPPQKRRKRN